MLGPTQAQGCVKQIPVVGGRHTPRTRIGDILHSPGWDTTRPSLLAATASVQQQRRKQRSYKCSCRITAGMVLLRQGERQG